MQHVLIDPCDTCIVDALCQQQRRRRFRRGLFIFAVVLLIGGVLLICGSMIQQAIIATICA
jgi:hypothetical protein